MSAVDPTTALIEFGTGLRERLARGPLVRPHVPHTPTSVLADAWLTILQNSASYDFQRLRVEARKALGFDALDALHAKDVKLPEEGR